MNLAEAEIVRLTAEIARLQAIVDANYGNSFLEELTHLINRYSEENGSDTPDYILASYLVGCLEVWNAAVRQRETWRGEGILFSIGHQCLPGQECADCAT